MDQHSQENIPPVKPLSIPQNNENPFSKILIVLFVVVMPFVGFYIGYTQAPEKIVEVERVVVQEILDQEKSSANEETAYTDIEQLTQLPLLDSFQIKQENEQIVFSWSPSEKVVSEYGALSTAYISFEFDTDEYPKAIGDGFTLDASQYTLSNQYDKYDSFVKYLESDIQIVATLAYQPSDYECTTTPRSPKDCTPVYTEVDQALRERAELYKYVHNVQQPSEEELLITEEDVVSFLNTNEQFGFIDVQQIIDGEYIVIGNGVYFARGNTVGTTPGFVSLRKLFVLPEPELHRNGIRIGDPKYAVLFNSEGKTKIQTFTHGGLVFMVYENKVYQGPDLLEGIDAANLELKENIRGQFYIQDEDSIFFIRSNCSSQIVTPGTFEEKDTFWTC